MTIIKRLDNALYFFEKWFVAFGIILATMMVFTGVLTRYFLSFSFPWIDELTQYIMLWTAFIGGSLCIRRGDHVSVDLIRKVISARKKYFFMGSLFLMASLFMLYFSYASLSLVIDVKSVGQKSRSMVFLPMYLVYIIAPIGSAIMSIEFFKLAFLNFKRRTVVYDLSKG